MSKKLTVFSCDTCAKPFETAAEADAHAIHDAKRERRQVSLDALYDVLDAISTDGLTHLVTHGRALIDERCKK